MGRATDTTETPENNFESKIEPRNFAEDECEEEAIRLALKYNFVTDVTSMVVEEEDEYVKKGTVGVSKEIVYENDDGYDYYGPCPNCFIAHSYSRHRSGGTGHSSGHSTGLTLKSSSSVVPFSASSYYSSGIV